MKTEQEQIEKMTNIIVETLQDKRVENGTTFVTYLPSLFGNNPDKEKEVAEALIENGYGDVSEYKAEIERLKADFITLECNYDKIYDEHKEHKIENENLKILNNKFRECIDYLKAEVKQAQIDVLNKLKKRARTSYVLDDFILGSVVFSKDIDELIDEVQNGKIY